MTSDTAATSSDPPSGHTNASSAIVPPAPAMIAVSSVISDRADEFENWFRTIVVPADERFHPEHAGRWQVLRAVAEDDGAMTFIFLFYGGGPGEWSLEPLLERALGADAAGRALADLTAMMKHEQVGWVLNPVELRR